MILENLHKQLLDNLKTGVVFLDSELRFIYINAAAQALLEISDRKVHDVFIGDVLVNADKDIDEIQTAMIEQHALASNSDSVSARSASSAPPNDGIRSTSMRTNSSRSSSSASNNSSDYTKVIIEEADRLHNLVDKLIGSRKPLELKEINIHEVLERVRNLVNAEINGEGIKLTFDYDPSIPFVVGDSEQMIQAMLNIVRNAMQSLNSPNVDHELGQIILRTRISRNVTIGVRFYRLAASIEVIDNGPGIPSDMLETIFFPMISGRANGTGLGLPITHGIINQHNGMIECRSEPGSTNFRVLLPIGKQIQTIIN